MDRFARFQPMMQADGHAESSAAPAGRVQWGKAVLDMLLIMLLTALGGVAAGVAMAGRPFEEALPIIGVLNILLATIGFTISAVRRATHRWVHLAVVTGLTWLASANNLLLGGTIADWLVAFPVLAVTAAIGGLVSYLFVRSRQSDGTV